MPFTSLLSITGKRWLLPELDALKVRALSEALAVDPVLAGVLYLRGIRSADQGKIFLESSLSQLTNPSQIPGITPAAERLAEAVRKSEKICVYGDYDVDGVTATALMVRVLRRFRARVGYFLPSRFKHGYGLHSGAVREIHESGVNLLITVDNGITAREQVSLARSLGMDVIITDHHEAPADLPDTPFIVNPKIRPDSIGQEQSAHNEEFSSLSGVGIAFALLVVLRSCLRDRNEVVPNLREYLDLVALGTIGDVVPLSGENRILVRHGLQEIARSRNIGIRALMQVSGLSEGPVTPGHVGFMLAPRINASGRLGDAELALRLLISSDEQEVRSLASTLNQANLKRQEIEQEILSQALEQLDGQGRDDKVIVLGSESWHPGVIGIVASRIVERVYRPVILLTGQEGTATGSGRSISRFSLYEALEACQEELHRFGGHKMAAGLTLSWDRIEHFREKINAYAERILKPDDLVPTIGVEGVLNPDQITDNLFQGLERLKPFGMGNPEPKFLSQGVGILNPRVVGENHLRFQIRAGARSVTAIGFNLGKFRDALSGDSAMDLVYHLRYNTYNGTRKMQAVLVDMMPSETG